MPRLGHHSLENLSSCDHRLQDVCCEAIKHVDFSVICGHRDKAAQDKACAGGLSKTPWPTSKHNSNPSTAVDVVPFSNGAAVWGDKALFITVADEMLTAATKYGVKLRWGGDWNGNGLSDEKFLDMPHFELAGD